MNNATHHSGGLLNRRHWVAAGLGLVLGSGLGHALTMPPPSNQPIGQASSEDGFSVVVSSGHQSAGSAGNAEGFRIVMSPAGGAASAGEARRNQVRTWADYR